MDMVDRNSHIKPTSCARLMKNDLSVRALIPKKLSITIMKLFNLFENIKPCLAFSHLTYTHTCAHLKPPIVGQEMIPL